MRTQIVPMMEKPTLKIAMAAAEMLYSGKTNTERGKGDESLSITVPAMVAVQ